MSGSAEQERREILAEVRRMWREARDPLAGRTSMQALADLVVWIEARGEPKHASDGFEGTTLTGPELIAKLRDNVPPAGTEHPMED